MCCSLFTALITYFIFQGDATLIRVKVLLFAGARELSGCNEGEIEANTTESYDTLLAKVVKHFSLYKIQHSLILAVNEEYPSQDKNLVLRNGDLIAVIPPLSGGTQYI
jgi:molybdopterin converting factor small subunit